MEEATTRRAAFGTLSVILLRMLSFVGTQYCYRKLKDPRVLGDTSIRLELLLTSVLFVSREGYRLAVPRTKHEGTAILTIPTTLVVASAAVFWHLHSLQETESDDYRFSGILYCLGALLEGLVEPIVLFFLCRVSVSEKAQAESIGVLVKTFSTVVALQYGVPPITAFGLAQIAYALVYGSILVTRYHLQKDILHVHRSQIFHRPTLQLTMLFTIQGLVKFALTEGDRIVLNVVADSYDQGIYALGNSYGGLAARLVLQPLEETARLLFGRFSRTNEQEDMLYTSYVVLVKGVLYIGLVFSCLAVNYTRLLLLILAGNTWGNNPEAIHILTAFCYYTGFLAWNGMTEAFVYGVAHSMRHISRIGVAHVTTGLVFLVLAPLSIRYYGTVGLVGANCVTMFGRTLFSIYFASHILEKPTVLLLLSQMLPRPTVLMAFAASYVITKLSLRRLEQTESDWVQGALLHISIGASCGIGVLSLAFLVEREFKAGLRRLWSGKTD